MVEDELVAILPVDAYHEMTALEWILQPKDKSEETLGLFNDFVRLDLEAKSSTGGITGFTAWNLKNSGFRFISSDDAVRVTEKQIDSQQANKVLYKMEEFYGKEYLEAMSADQLYTEYKNFLSVKTK